MFSVRTTLEGFKNATINAHFGLILFLKDNSRAGKSQDIREVIVFKKLRLQNVFRPHGN